jgi:hypothetical protein
MFFTALLGLRYLDNSDIDIRWTQKWNAEAEKNEIQASFSQFTRGFKAVELPYTIPRQNINPKHLNQISVTELQQFIGNAPIILPIENEGVASNFSELARRVDISDIAAYDLKPVENTDFTAVVIKFISAEGFQDYVCTFSPEGKIVSVLEAAGHFPGDMFGYTRRKAVIQKDYQIEIVHEYVRQQQQLVANISNITENPVKIQAKKFSYRIQKNGKIVPA